ncbi:hypothetical protein MSAN_01154500 [Mycena sanguinolenta]|uniref:Uncharacterized protein n=1 Tax=Mycena sanguinolenta TaxID=230812 RepID=A0A8H7D3V7_9AGAR|nr:hypothetical protein MSAN_01154500 [Mycena sanguinolenta]
MPALPSTLVSTPSLPAVVTYALIVCLALAAFVSFAAAAHFSVRSIRSLKERRTSTLDVEQSVDTTVCSVKELPEGFDMSRQSIAAATLATARANLPASLEANGIIKICPLNVRMVLAKVAPRCHLKQLREYENPARFDATRRRTTAGPSALRNVVGAQDNKRASAAAVLAAARARLPATNVTPKAVVVVDLAKVLGNVAPRSQLKTLNREAPAHFGASRTRSPPWVVASPRRRLRRTRGSTCAGSSASDPALGPPPLPRQQPRAFLALVRQVACFQSSFPCASIVYWQALVHWSKGERGGVQVPASSGIIV